MTEPIMKKVKGDGVDINLAIWEGTGTPILFIHGITANCRCWDVFASILSPTYQVMAMDLKGRGQSDKPATGYSIDHHLKDINCLLDDLGLEQAVIAGHSLGAFITLAFGAEYPERTDRIILVDGGGDLSEEQMNNVFEGIRPSLERLVQVFPSADAYVEAMKQAPYIQPWSPAIETYYRYEITDMEGGVKTNIDPLHIQEEAENVINSKNLKDASIKKTEFASLVEVYIDEYDMEDNLALIKEKGYFPYVVEFDDDSYALFVGAFVGNEAAESFNFDLLSDGIQSRVVGR